MTLWPWKAITSGIFAFFFLTFAAAAQSSENGLEIELMQLKPRAAADEIELMQLKPRAAADGADTSCDMIWRVRNRSGTKLSRAVFSVGFITPDDTLFNSVGFSNLPAARSKLFQFTMPHECNSYQQVLFSDVVECLDEASQPVEGICEIELLSLSSPRTQVEFYD